MLDLGLGSLHTFTLRDLAFVLIAMAIWIAAIIAIGFDTVVVGIVVANAMAILFELAQRGWRRVRRSQPPPES